MYELQRNGLWGGGLIIIESSELIARYNECLVDMGLSETKLEVFRIDCMGWSPEIAEEKDDQYYLSHGIANQMAIIVTPDQYKKPVYVPFHSFDLTLIRQWFKSHKAQIIELTKTTGIWLHIDQKIDQYHDPDDVLLIDNITVRAYTPSGLMRQAEIQKKLVRQFMEGPRDSSKMSDVLMSIPPLLQKSVEEVGSVTYRQMVIKDMSFSLPCSFFVRAFGGLFILRSADCEREVIITREDAMHDIGVTSSMDKKILRSLERFGLISYETERWINRLYRLEVIRDSFLMDVLEEQYPDLNFAELSEVLQKEVLMRTNVQKALPEEYELLDRVIMKIRSGRLPKRLSAKIKPFLAHPLKSLDRATREVVWYILALVCDGRSIVRLYRYDKDSFIERYRSWNVPRQTWVIDCVKKYHIQKRAA